jgi:hypothetical protein
MSNEAQLARIERRHQFRLRRLAAMRQWRAARECPACQQKYSHAEVKALIQLALAGGDYAAELRRAALNTGEPHV